MSKALQSAKYVNAIPPAAILDDASATAVAVNTQGYAQANFLISLGATDIAMTALKVQESDDDSSYADVTGAIFGTSADPTGTTSSLPSATDDNKVFGIFVDLKGRKKYLKLVATFGNGTAGGYCSAICVLTQGSVQNHTAAGLNVGNYLVV